MDTIYFYNLIGVLLIYSKLHKLKVYNLMNSDLCIHPETIMHNQDNEYIHPP